MNILICNVGSTSLKYQLFRMPEELVLASGGVERVGAGDGRFLTKNFDYPEKPLKYKHIRRISD